MKFQKLLGKKIISGLSCLTRKIVSTRQSWVSGFTLVETLVAIAIFCIIALAVYNGFASVNSLSQISQLKAQALALSIEQIEVVRNLPYADVGLTDGLPPGKILPSQNLTRGGRNFLVTTTVRETDDSFDGVAGLASDDQNQADYKTVEVIVACPGCKNFNSVAVDTLVGSDEVTASSSYVDFY